MRLAAVALLVLLPLAALAAEEPEAVYAKFHRALASRDFEEMLRHGPAARRQEMAGVSQAQRDAALKMANLMMPRAYRMLGKTVSPNGRTAQLVLSGTAETLGGRLETMYGTVRMLNENGAWKVDESSWSNEKPAGLAQLRPAAPAAGTAAKAQVRTAPGAPPVVGSSASTVERKLGTAKPPCVYKSVMTAEDIENCR